MKLSKFIKDKLYILIIGALFTGSMEILFMAFHMSAQLMWAFAILMCMFLGLILAWEYMQKKGFYGEFIRNVELLDKKYLVLEMLEEPDFYEGQLLYQSLYEIHKSMIENVRRYEDSVNDFKDYIEMWIHEVKIPIASLMLASHNNKNSLDRKYIEQIRRLDNIVEQVLYYVRAENAEQDYLIKEVNLKEIVKKTAMKNKDDLLNQGMDFVVENVDVQVVTDEKWLEFILNQLVNNSMKYKKPQIPDNEASPLSESILQTPEYEVSDNEALPRSESILQASEHETSQVPDNEASPAGKPPLLRIWAEEAAAQESGILGGAVYIHVWDNGMGISAGDLPRIFDKSFTGENGRMHAKSTGMGLYIVKSLCDRLGHRIDVQSKQGDYTEFVITIGMNDMYNLTKS